MLYNVSHSKGVLYAGMHPLTQTLESRLAGRQSGLCASPSTGSVVSDKSTSVYFQLSFIFMVL